MALGPILKPLLLTQLLLDVGSVNVGDKHSHDVIIDSTGGLAPQLMRSQRDHKEQAVDNDLQAMNMTEPEGAPCQSSDGKTICNNCDERIYQAYEACECTAPQECRQISSTDAEGVIAITYRCCCPNCATLSTSAEE
eukprot:gb/GFBE01047658.1/.p1 GENE.gb/GFBE01047658.1/~~gb/GFBE01047658.1/.p1  ORF type:complete len:137 (+),score=25.97 gb/GFBE01047658.1/:1-411(+)